MSATHLSLLSCLYLEYLAVMNYSPRTIEQRDMILKHFIEWCSERGIDKANDITKPILERYRRYLHHSRDKRFNPMSARNQAVRLTPLQMMFKWATQQNYLLYNPASELEMPRTGRPLPKEPLSDRAMDWLQKYLTEVRSDWVILPEPAQVFLKPSGQPIPSRIVGKFIKHAGIDKAGGCHLFGHTLATLILNNGADLRYVQEMLKHAVIITTEIYTHVSSAKLKRIHSMTHPAAMAGRQSQQTGITQEIFSEIGSGK